MLKGFKDFILRGNVVDFAVAVVIGAAFTALVNLMVSAIIKPVLNSFGGANSSGLGFSIRTSTPELTAATYVDLSAIINAVIVFIITAAVVYFILVAPMNTIAERRKKGLEPEPEKPSEEILLLTEIRDALRAGK